MTPSDTPTLDLAALRAAVTGPVLTPADDGYDAARALENLAFDRRPTAIARPRDAADVAAAVRAAAAAGLPIAVRGAGHGFAGHGVADDALVIDLSAMRAVEIDATGRTAWAQGGATAGEYTAAAAAHGLATGFGDTGTVGIAGLTLGGGIGWLARRHGMTIDDLLAVELVTLDGELRTVDAEHEPDLFWALRGGGGNFGVVTRLRFRLHPLATVLAGTIVLPADAGTIAGLLAAADAAPEELTTITHVALAPPLPFLPAEHHGALVAMVGLVWSGDVEAGERAIAPIRRLATPLADMVAVKPYPEVFEGDGPPPGAFAVRSALLDDLGHEQVAALLDGLTQATTPFAMVELRVLGGAMARVDPDATAFAHRARRLMVTLAARSLDPADGPSLEAAVQRRAEDAGLAGRDVYVNYAGGDAAAALAAAYPPGTARRLAEVKRRYDPDNLLRSNHNVAPAA